VDERALADADDVGNSANEHGRCRRIAAGRRPIHRIDLGMDLPPSKLLRRNEISALESIC